jgi:hypothetical protein
VRFFRLLITATAVPRELHYRAGYASLSLTGYVTDCRIEFRIGRVKHSDDAAPVKTWIFTSEAFTEVATLGGFTMATTKEEWRKLLTTKRGSSRGQSTVRMWFGAELKLVGLAYVVGVAKRSALPSLLVFLVLTGIAAPNVAALLTHVSTASLTFGSQVAGTTSSAQPVTITNGAPTGLSVTSITITGNFTEADTCLPSSNVIAMGQSCIILVSYAPTAAQPDTGQMSITFSDGTSQAVSLSGTGVSSGVTLSPSSLSFGSQEFTVPVGLSPSTSAAQVVTLTNTGATTLGVASVAVTGDFTEVDDCTLSSPAVTQIAPGFSCLILVNFAPTAAGTRTGQVTVTDSSGNEYVIALTGLGNGTTALRLRGASVTFGSQAVGTTSVAQVITIINDGMTTANLQITNLSIAGDFAITGNNCVGASIQTGYSCEILATFAPTQAGDRSGQIVITDNGYVDFNGYLPNVISLGGSGTTAGVSLSTSAVSFGTEKVGGPGPVQSIVLTNTGTSNLTINYVDYIDDFLNTAEHDNCTALPPATSNPILPGGSCTIQVTDATGAALGRTLVGKIILDDSDGASPHVIAVAGPGAAIETMTPSFLGAAGSVSFATGYSGAVVLGKISTIGGFTETDDCTSTSAACTINVGFPAASGTVQTGQVIADEPTFTLVSPIVAALSTAGNATPFVSTMTELADSSNSSVFGQSLSLTATVGVVAPATGTPTGSVTFLDGSTPIGTGTLTAGQASFSTTALVAGAHSITAFYTGGGNFLTSVSTAVNQTVSQAMTTTLLTASPLTTTAGQPVSLTATVSPIAPGAGTPTGSVTFYDGATSIGVSALSPGGPATLTTSTLAAGPHSLTATYGGDAEFSTSTSSAVTATITVINSVPVAITSGAGTTFTEGAAASFSITTSGSPTPTLSESGALPSGVTFADNGNGTATLAGTPATGTHGTYAITITAANGVSTNAVQNFTLAVNEGAAITSGSGTTFTEQVAGSFTVTTVGFPAPALTETGALPSGVTFTDNSNGTGMLSGTPAVSSAGIYSLTITANNGVGTPATQTFTLTVNSGTSITSGSSTTFTVGSPAFFSVTTVGIPAAAITEVGALPGGVTFVDNGNGTATLSGTPGGGAAGSYPLTITANNGVSTPASQSFTLNVNQGPAITTGNSTTFTIGSQGSFTVLTTGVPTPAITETGSLPNGVTFTDNGNGTATLAGTPAYGTAGSYPFTVTASNGVGTPAMQAFTLAVNQGPAITSANTTTFSEQVAGSFTVTATGSPTPQITEVGSLPTGVTLVDNGNGTAILSGTPAAGTGGNYGFTITAANGVLPNATQTFTLIVSQAPSITSANATTFTVGTSGSYTVTTTGVPAPALTLSGTPPVGITFVDNGNGTATLSGSAAPGTGGDCAFIITASNGTTRATTQNFALIVDEAPTISATGSTIFYFGSQGSITIKATGFPAPALSESGSLPTGVTFDAATGLLAGTPAPGTGGVYALTFTAINGVGSGAIESLTLTVQGQLSLPAFTSANKATFAVWTATVNGQTSYEFLSNSFLVTTTGSPTPAIFAKCAGCVSNGLLPPGLQFVDNHNGTATLSATGPATSNLQTSPLTLTAVGAGGASLAATQAFTLMRAHGSLPTFTSPNRVEFIAGQPNSFTVAAGPYVDTITATGLNGLGFTDNHDGTATLSGSPAATDCSTGCTITLTASKASLANVTPPYTVKQKLELVVTGPGDALPVFTSANKATFPVWNDRITTPTYELLSNSFLVTTTGKPAPAITACLVGVSGCTLAGSALQFVDNGNGTATLSTTARTWTGHLPTTFQLKLTATGEGGASFAASQTFTLTIASRFTYPTFTSPNKVEFLAGQPNSFTVAAGPYVNEITANNGIGGITFVDNHDGTATLSGSPAATDCPTGCSFTFTASNIYTINVDSGNRPYKVTQTFELLVVP